VRKNPTASSFQVHAVAEANFKKQGFEVIRHTKLTPEELAKVRAFSLPPLMQ
jgi:hypothetical protein